MCQVISLTEPCTHRIATHQTLVAGLRSMITWHCMLSSVAVAYDCLQQSVCANLSLTSWNISFNFLVQWLWYSIFVTPLFSFLWKQSPLSLYRTVICVSSSGKYDDHFLHLSSFMLAMWKWVLLKVMIWCLRSRHTKHSWKRKAKTSSIFGCRADVSQILVSKMEIRWHAW